MAFDIRQLLRRIHNLINMIFRTMQMHLNIVFQAQSEYAQKETNVFCTIEYGFFNIETREKQSQSLLGEYFPHQLTVYHHIDLHFTKKAV